MGHRFEKHDEVTLDATPEQVWDAIATGPGIDSWFMGRNDVEPGEGGTVRTLFGGYAPESPITSWEPGKRLAYGGEQAEDGRFVAYEFLIEGRGGGSTVLRMVTSGFIPGDDWADEFEAMSKGGALFFSTLATYLTHFAGRVATPLTVFGPPVGDWERTWSAVRAALVLGEHVSEGDAARFTVDGDVVEGVVYSVNSQTLGIRTPDALYRFLQGFHGSLVAGHHYFSTVDITRTENVWQAWLAGLSQEGNDR
ncbi:SRPBCC family protein [Prauserella endophytica]|uniref:SRPBCC domain-containing protein n=1 Tax=Prauserella endophytica TaxID=1592324 RepID=A0ABY2S194_9PSEU|nr:SRPBCC domain-containing protein [Prauserella endophytica]TKG68358.1 SRPBCC domain-containing protein [Prauserella endophytica]